MVPEEMTWEEPPPSGRAKRRKCEQWVAALRENPERWARLRTYKNASSVSASRHRLLTLYPDCEFIQRGLVLYGRHPNGATNVKD